MDEPFSYKRLFLCAPVSRDIFQQLKDNLSEAVLPRGRWNELENAHITIRFFGIVTKEDLEMLKGDINAGIRDNFSPFSVSIQQIAVFPLKRKNLVVAHVSPNKHLHKLFNIINDIHVTGAKKIHSQFIPHITLFRAQAHHRIAMSEVNIPNLSFKIAELNLCESVWQSGQRVYQILEKWTL